MEVPEETLLLSTADAALPSSMLSIGDTLISGICVALALCIAVLRGSKNRFFNCAFLRYIVSLNVTIIIMSWFQATRLSWRMMGKVWDGGEDDGTALLEEDRGDGSSTGSDHGDDPDPPDPGDDPEDVSSSVSDEDKFIMGSTGVQLLSLRANFPIAGINCYDSRMGYTIYRARVPHEEVQEDGMVDLVPIGPSDLLEVCGALCFMVYPYDGEGGVGTPIEEHISTIFEDEDEVEEQTQTIDGGLGRKLEITSLLMPAAIDTDVEVRLNLKDLGLRRRNVYGSIKASTIDYGGKSISLFCVDKRGRSFPCGSTFILPLRPSKIAVPYRRHFKLHLEVDLRVTTSCDSQEEDKSLKFCLEFTYRVKRQEREVDGDQVEVNVFWYY